MANLTPSSSRLTVPETLQTNNPSVPIAVADEIYVSGTAPSSGNSIKDHLDDLAAKIAAAGSGSWKDEYRVLTEYHAGDMVWWEDTDNKRRFFIRRADGRSVGNPGSRPQDWDELGITDIARLVMILVAGSAWKGEWKPGSYAEGDFCRYTLAGELHYYERNTAGTDGSTTNDTPPINTDWTRLEGDEESAVKVLEAATDAESAITQIATLTAQSVGLTPAQGDRGYALRRKKDGETYEYVIPPLTWRDVWAADSTYYTGDAVSHTERLWVLTGTGHIAAGLTGEANAPGAVSAWVALTDTDSHTADWAEAGNDDLIPPPKIAGAYYGEWNDVSSAQDFKVGDRTTHNDRPFTCILDHTKGASAPDIDYQHWEADEHWWGDWADFWFPLGVFSRSGGRLWWASADVARGDPAPTASGNAKWWQVASHLPPLTWGKAWADGAYWAGTMVTDDDRLFVARQDIVAGNPQPSKDADETYWLACDSDSGIAPGAFYEHLVSALVAGGGITLTPDADAHTVSVSADLVRPIAPTVVGAFWGRAPFQDDDSSSPLRLRAVDSNDLRTPPAESYSYIYGERYPSEGGPGNIQARNNVDLNISNYFVNPYPDNPSGYDSSRPGILYDRNDGPPHSNQWNMNGVDWTAQNAGQASPREFDVTLTIAPANDRLYTTDENLEVWLQNAGGGNRVQVTRLSTSFTFHFDGGHQAEFTHTWRVTLSGAPRSGEHDWFSVHILARTGSSQVTAQTYSRWSLTFSLPHLGRNVAQQYSWGGSAAADTGIDGYVLDLAVHGTDHQGKSTQPGETDKAEIDLQDWGHLSDKARAMHCLRDMRDVVIGVKNTTAPTWTHPDPTVIEVWTRLDGLLAPQRVHEFRLPAGDAFDLEYHTGPVLEGQLFALVSRQAGNSQPNIIGHDVNASVLGNPVLSWDPTIDTTYSSTRQVIAGLLSTHIAEYSGGDRSAGDHAIGYVISLAPPTQWEQLRIMSNGVRSTVAIPADLVIPTRAGAPAATHPTLGPVSVRGGGSSSGTIYHDRTISVWKDGDDATGQYKLRIYDGASHMSDPWIDHVELEYHI